MGFCTVKAIKEKLQSGEPRRSALSAHWKKEKLQPEKRGCWPPSAHVKLALSRQPISAGTITAARRPRCRSLARRAGCCLNMEQRGSARGPTVVAQRAGPGQAPSVMRTRRRSSEKGTSGKKLSLNSAHFENQQMYLKKKTIKIVLFRVQPQCLFPFAAGGTRVASHSAATRRSPLGSLWDPAALARRRAGALSGLPDTPVPNPFLGGISPPPQGPPEPLTHIFSRRFFPGPTRHNRKLESQPPYSATLMAAQVLERLNYG